VGIRSAYVQLSVPNPKPGSKHQTISGKFRTTCGSFGKHSARLTPCSKVCKHVACSKVYSCRHLTNVYGNFSLSLSVPASVSATVFISLGLCLYLYLSLYLVLSVAVCLGHSAPLGLLVSMGSMAVSISVRHVNSSESIHQQFQNAVKLLRCISFCSGKIATLLGMCTPTTS
jgi:hypothetical protein